ncbi:MAG: glucosamine inositolphosphorylceramide transferase family protein [Betaproteobacteria bacterium]
MASLALAASPQPRKLRVGIFAGGRLQPRWLVEGLARAARSEFAEVTVIALSEPARQARAGLLGAYARIDQWAFGAEPCEPLELPAHVPHQVLIQGKTWSVPDFLRFRLDVALALGELDDAALDGIAALGVWRYGFDGFREVADGKPVTGSRLLARLAAGAPPRIAYESWSRTYPLSVARNRGELLYKTAEFAERALREAHRSGRAWLEQCRFFKVDGEGAATPSATSLLKIGGRILRRGVEKALGIDQWFLAFSLGNAAPNPSLAGFTRLLPPRDRDWADPFAIEKGGRYYVFFEELPRAARKAHISMLEIDAEGRWSAPVRVLERDYHLSYPFLLEHEGALYMIPESAQRGRVELYRCTDFPRRWRLEKTLLEGVRLVDPTLHRGPDRWWLFANAAPGASRVFDDELHLYHAPALAGEWQPHRRNPVRSDARCARPAGRLFWRNGALHRPAQICVPRYGAGIAVHRVLRLTPHEYAERQVERVLPAGDGLLGLHTLNRAGHLTVVDGFTRRRRL